MMMGCRVNYVKRAGQPEERLVCHLEVLSFTRSAHSVMVVSRADDRADDGLAEKADFCHEP